MGPTRSVPTDLLVVPTAEDRASADALPLTTRFELGDRITGVQQAFLDQHGFLVFAQVASPDEVARLAHEIDQVQAKLLADGTERVHGIPLIVGEDPDGAPFIQRIPFAH